MHRSGNIGYDITIRDEHNTKKLLKDDKKHNMTWKIIWIRNKHTNMSKLYG